MPTPEKEAEEQRTAPIWSECYTGGWDIRVWPKGAQFEACFHHVDLWHEHVTADSLEAVLTLARATIDQRISGGK